MYLGYPYRGPFERLRPCLTSPVHFHGHLMCGAAAALFIKDPTLIAWKAFCSPIFLHSMEHIRSNESIVPLYV